VLLFATDIVAALENDRWPRWIEAHAAWIAPLGDGIELLLKYSSHYVNAGAKCFDWPEQKYISDAGKKAPELGAFSLGVQARGGIVHRRFRASTARAALTFEATA